MARLQRCMLICMLVTVAVAPPKKRSKQLVVPKEENVPCATVPVQGGDAAAAAPPAALEPTAAGETAAMESTAAKAETWEEGARGADNVDPSEDVQATAGNDDWPTVFGTTKYQSPGLRGKLMMQQPSYGLLDIKLQTGGDFPSPP